MVALLLARILILYILASIDARRIKNSVGVENIDHDISVLYELKFSAATYIITLTFVAWFDLESLMRFAIATPLVLLFSRWLFYDIFLNLLRGKKWNYEAPSGDGASFIDTLEKKYKIRFIQQRLISFALLLACIFVK
jgi:hypothetical protein